MIQDGWYGFDNDINSLIMALNGCYVASGMAVAEDSPLDMGVVVAAGTYYANGTKVVKGSETNLPLDASDPGLPRKDLIVGDSAGTISFVKGTAAAAFPGTNTGPSTYQPVPPNIPTDKTILGEVWVGAGVNSIADASITDRRIILDHVDADKLESSTKVQVQDHTPKAHTLDSHSSKPHSELSDAPADAHHAEAHDLASHSTKAHSELTGVTASQHHDHSLLSLGAPTELTIAGGVITVTQSHHLIDTEGDAGTDDLDTILGGVDGMILVLRQAAGDRDPTIKHGTGNIYLPGGTDITLTTVRMQVTLKYDADVSRWHRMDGA